MPYRLGLARGPAANARERSTLQRTWRLAALGPCSDLVAELWDNCDAALSSRLAYPEVRAALAASARNHDLGEEDLLTAEHAWEEFWAATRPVELTPAVERQAGQLAKSHALRGAGAVHMASALALNDPDLVVAVWDRRLHVGVLAVGGRVAPANLDAGIHRTERPAPLG